MKKLAIVFVVALLCLGGAYLPQAQALTLGSVDGGWSNVVGGASVITQNATVSYGNTNQRQVRWGTGTSGQSGLGFTGVAPPAKTFAPEADFEIGQLVHFNRPINAGTAASSAELTISLVFSDPATLTGTFDFTFNVNETPNNATPPSNPLNDDFIYFPSAFSTETIVIDNITYTLKLLGFGASPENLVDQFRSSEGSDNATLVWGRITEERPPAVPLPGAVLLLGGGLARLIAYGRRRRS
jgi:hypothetical protein